MTEVHKTVDGIEQKSVKKKIELNEDQWQHIKLY